MDWAAFVSTLVGAVVSIGTSLAVFGFTSWTESKKAKAEMKAKDAFIAFRGLQKLLKTQNSLTNLAEHIDQQLKVARELERHDQVPASILGQMLGAPVEIEDVTAEEAIFLVKVDPELVACIWEIQQRARQNEQLIETYNKTRQEYEQYIESKADVIDSPEGQAPVIVLKDKDAIFAHSRRERLGQIMDPLIVALKEDSKAIATVIERFFSAAIATFGDDFPGKKIVSKDRVEC